MKLYQLLKEQGQIDYKSFRGLDVLEELAWPVRQEIFECVLDWAADLL